MKINKIIDTIINVLFPVIIGAVIYFLSANNYIEGFIRNQLPDGLWAYAFFSAMLIIWQREINIFWILIVLMVCILFELFQYLHFINGTGDMLDVVTYFVFSGIAFLLNKTFKNTIYIKPKPAN